MSKRDPKVFCIGLTMGVIFLFVLLLGWLT